MLPAITTFGDSSSGIGALGFDPKAFLIQLVTFILAYLVLKRWAFGPITKLLNERRETIDRGVKLGEDMQKEKAELEKQVGQQLHEARQEADKMIAGAQDTAHETIREAEEAARKKSDNIVAEAEGRIATDAARVRKQLEGELAGLVAEATEAVIDEKIDAKKDAQLIDKALRAKEKQTA